MPATLPTPLAGLADRIRGLLRAHRAGLRTRVYETAALDAPVLPAEVVPVVTPDGARLRVHAYGPADGDAVVLVHGWSCCIEYWNPQINAFAGDYRVIAYDQRGHGDSDRGGLPPNPDLLADDLSAVLAATLRPGQRAVLVGHSMGGMTIQAWAGRHPEEAAERAAAVVLTNTAAGNLIAETTVVPLLNRGPLRLPYRIGRRALGSPLLIPPVWPVTWIFRRTVMSLAATGDIAAFGLNIVRSCPARVRGAFGILLAELALGDAVTHLTAPTTVIAGSVDRMTPVRHAERLVEMLRGVGTPVRMSVLPTGHLGNVEAYQQFNAELDRVLATAYPARAASA
ncbi:alpha/beta fold hydrolase [Nocardia terpenica]|uniref:Alpha/beta hydrolase n=1 Tax=Nocardia terpenica TaxID=455432 RepID=A0A291RTQ5_9NOCA|nr:alpha/beta hydrolase [Nocardia terpenica]ATL70971.1 alpha/beta hydrolase [Nocardia terpenica]